MTVSAFRTVQLGKPIPTYGISPTWPLLNWPMAGPDALLDYSADATAMLAEVGDSFTAAALSIAPSGFGELGCTGLSVDAGVITAKLGNGFAGRSYVVRLQGWTAQHREFEWTVGLTLARLLPATGALIPPPSSDFGLPINWPVPGGEPMQLLLNRRLTTSVVAAIF